MNWVASLKKAIDYMEENLLTNIGAEDVADAVHISPFYFQKGFKIVTGYSIGEYLRNRRLYLAGLDVIQAKTGSAQCSDIKLPLLPACYTQFVIKRLCNFHIPAMMVYAF